MEPPAKKLKPIEIQLQDFDDDALLEIFSFLDETSLIAARKTCTRWRNLIDENPSFYRHIRLNIEDDNEALEKFKSLNYQRVYQRWFPAYRDHETIFTVKVFDHLAAHIKDVLFHSMPLHFFKHNCYNFQNLEKLIIKNLFHYDDLYKPTPCEDNCTKCGGLMEFPKLKHLEIWRCKSEVPIIAPNVVKLHLKGHLPMRELLDKFPMLQHLSCDASKLIKKDVNELEEISQKLTSFKFNLECCSRLEKTNLIPFLTAQVESLKDLQFYGENLNSEIEFAIFEMKLEKLAISVPEIFDKRMPNMTIKTFAFRNNYYYHEKQKLLLSLEIISESCPEVENLIVNSGSYDYESRTSSLHETIGIAARIFSKVEYLKVKDNNLKNFERSFIFSTVQNLEIEANYESENESLMNLILCCENVKKIKITRDTRYLDRDVHLTLEQFSEVFTSLKDLEDFSATYAFRLSSKIVDFLVGGKLKLKKLNLEVAEKDFEEQKKLSERIGRESSIQSILTIAPKPDYASDWEY